MNRTLMIGYDGSPEGEDALALGRVLAGALEARPLVVTVMPHLAHLLSSPKFGATLDEQSEPILTAARERLGGHDVGTRVIVDRSPARAIHELAEGVQPVAVVLGSAHHGRVGRVLLGSVGAALLSGAPSPVAVAPSGYASHKSEGFESLAVAFSGAAESWAALEAAGDLARLYEARLTILGAVEPVRYGYPAPYPMLDAASYFEAREEDMKRALAEAMDRLPAGVGAEERLLSGDPARVIAEAATEFDLLVLGSRGYGPLRRVLTGSVSARLIADARCPILVLPRGAGDDPFGIRERARGLARQAEQAS